MGNKVRSARGVMVDFDLMQIKKQIASSPAPVEVQARQNFIENRLKRKLKKAQNIVDESTNKDIAPELPEPAVAVDESHIEDDTKEVVSEALAAVEETVEPVKEEKKVVVKKTTRKTTKQVARPKKTTQDTE